MSPSLCCTSCYPRREEGGVFRFSLPLQDLVNVELQPEIYFRCVLFKKKENWSTWSCSRRSTSGACA